MPTRSRRSVLAMLLATPAVGCSRGAAEAPTSPEATAPPTGPADLVVHNADVITLDAARPRAQSVAVRGGRIVAVGGSDLRDAWEGPGTRTLDASGGTVTPGLVDAHAHLVGIGQSLQNVDLRGAASMDEVVQRLRDHAPAEGWVTGRGWDQNLWPQGEMPTHHPLTQAFPDRPVWLRRVDGHAGWGNAALLRTSGIRPDTPVPEGGEILRDGSGTATGVLVDAAMGLVRPPAPSASDLERWIQTGAQHLLERGLTGVHEMGIGPDEDAAYRKLASTPDGLTVRVQAYASEGWFMRDLQQQAPDPIRPDAVYTLGGVKIYADGALGSRGAALLAPYADRAGHSGLMQHDLVALDRVVRAALKGGWQVATHAIGDAANRAVLDAYAAALDDAALSDPRPRIEHCQILAPEDIPRFAQLGVIASMQPTHATSDMPWVPARLGADRTAGAYAWQSLLQGGAHVCFGSDAPVELADVTHGLYAAITRQDASGSPQGGWLPEQRVSLHDALRGFSTEAAYAAHRDQHLGRVQVGARADLTCFGTRLDADNPAAVRSAAVQGCVVEGLVRHWVGA